MHTITKVLAMWALAGSLASCSSNGGDETSDKACGETFSAGMTKPGEGGEISFTLVSSQPAPPQRFKNLWIVELKDTDGAPIIGATVEAYPDMPAHGHGSPEPVVVEELQDGRYQLNPVNLSMTGLWETTIDATTSDGTTDSAMFAFCI